MARSVCFFVSDLHGRADRYGKLLAAALAEPPAAIFLGGDLLPTPFSQGGAGFVEASLMPRFRDAKLRLGDRYPRVFLIPGNDDPRSEKPGFCSGERDGLWELVHGRKAEWRGHPVYGYACVPPTPFRLKDWERYDVSRIAGPGCISPEEGRRTVPVPEREARLGTIAADLLRLAGDDDVGEAIFLFHAPPYGTRLDRAALDGMTVGHVPLDVHIGSLAIRRFIESRQPLLTLHGHVHESARLTGSFSGRIGRTVCLSAAHDGPELALVRFDPGNPADATRDLI
jgi:Icc-related predicted phosphoesterase